MSRSSSPLPRMELPAPFLLWGTEISMMLPRYLDLEWFTSALSHLNLGDAMVSPVTRKLREGELWKSCCKQGGPTKQVPSCTGHICASSKAVAGSCHHHTLAGHQQARFGRSGDRITPLWGRRCITVPVWRARCVHATRVKQNRREQGAHIPLQTQFLKSILSSVFVIMDRWKGRKEEKKEKSLFYSWISHP